MPSAAQRFDPVLVNVGAARRYAVQVLLQAGVARLQDDVRTVVSELATNAVLHARTVFTVELTITAGSIRIAVTDQSPTKPRLSRYSGQDATTGRGLRIVAELSSTWGVKDSGTSKTTWCELPLLPHADRVDGSAAHDAGIPDAVHRVRPRSGDDPPWNIDRAAHVEPDRMSA